MISFNEKVFYRPPLNGYPEYFSSVPDDFSNSAGFVRKNKNGIT